MPEGGHFRYCFSALYLGDFYNNLNQKSTTIVFFQKYNHSTISDFIKILSSASMLLPSTCYMYFFENLIFEEGETEREGKGKEKY